MGGCSREGNTCKGMSGQFIPMINVRIPFLAFPPTRAVIDLELVIVSAFQCQWEGCGKFFSRHDNLNQHLRVHRELGLTDQEFSQQISHHFSLRLMSSGKVQPSPTVRKRQPTEKGRSKKSGRKGRKGSSRGKEGEGETSAEEEEEGEGAAEGEAERIHDTI